MRTILFRFTLIYIIASALLRLVFSYSLLPEPLGFAAITVSKETASLLWWGLTNDLLIVGYLLLCYQLLVAALKLAGKFSLKAQSAISMLLIILAVIQGLLDWFFWFEFESRANRLIFHYLQFPWEVIVFLNEQFFLAWLLLVLVPLLFAGFIDLNNRLAARLIGDSSQSQLPPRKQLFRLSVLLIGVVIITPLLADWGGFKDKSSRRNSEIINNGLLNLMHAAGVNVRDWQKGYAYFSSEKSAAIAQPFQFSSDPSISSSALYPDTRHVVLIIEESFSAYRTWDLEQRQNLMPNLHKLVKQGTAFSNVYATGSRTTRGLEAILHGYPPLPGIALNQRKGIERLPSLARAMQENGFMTHFIYGGWPGFSHFSQYWQSIGFEQIMTRDDFPNPQYETSWGVSDQELFERVAEVMDQQTANGESLFISTLTVSNHRPYAVPKIADLNRNGQRELENAIAYADWSLGHFFEIASTRNWYKDTLFIIVADHGPRQWGNATIPVSSFEIPMVLFKPGQKPITFNRLGSNMDLPATLLSSLGLQSQETFWGKDLTKPGEGWALMENDYHVGILNGNNLLTLLPYKGEPETWQIDKTRAAQRAKLQQQSLDQVIGIFQTAHELFYP